MKRCLITGGEGFIGSHLADLLVEKGLPVYTMVYADAHNLDHLRDKITVLHCDMGSRQKVEEIIELVKPEIVFHLAAQSFVTVSWEEPEETLKTNVLGSFYLLESLRQAQMDPLIEIVGSSAVYGPREEKELPLGEETNFKPTSMYAVSKVGEEMLGYFYWKVFGMKVIRVRPFNMTGPRKTEDACSDFSKGIVEIEKGLRDELEVGNLETVRDFTDGRDAVKALWLLVENGKPGELYNLCSGRSWKMKDILDTLISLSGRNIRYRVVAEKMRPYDDPIYIGDSAKLRALGWEPEISMKKTLSDSLDYWRNNILALAAEGAV
jgi:GDP-4-dehydro-6-deoxy-D-mannose reductase